MLAPFACGLEPMRAQIWCGVLREHDIEAEVWHECTPFIYGPQPIFGAVLAVPESEWATAAETLAAKTVDEIQTAEMDLPTSEAVPWDPLPDAWSLAVVGAGTAAMLASFEVLTSALRADRWEDGFVESLMLAVTGVVLAAFPAMLVGAVGGFIIWLGLRPMLLIYRYVVLGRLLALGLFLVTSSDFFVSLYLILRGGY
ncbi:MAG: hypothetical protein ACR2OZ_16125 [Verrucomicrobiales bacterium]